MRQQAGFTLVELVVAMMVMVVGIVGSIAVQATAKKNSFDAMQRAQATAMAHDVIERMRVNKSQLASYIGTDYGNKTFNNVTMCHKTNEQTLAVNCTPAQLATYDAFQWNALLQGASVTKTVSDGSGQDNTISVGGLVNPTGCIFINMASSINAGQLLTNAGSVQVVVSWAGRFSTKDANDSIGKNCGGESDDKARRQVSISAYIY